MQFWGIEVKPGQTVSYDAGNEYVLIISQAALGETKKGNENVVVSVKIDDKKMVIGTLSAERHPQILCSLIFEKEFELSHSSKNASVFLCGYKTLTPDPFESDSGEDEDEEEISKNPVDNIIFEKTEGKAPVRIGKKTGVGKMEKHDDNSDEDESDYSYDDMDLSDDDDDDDMSEDESSGEEDDSSDEIDESDDEEDEETPKKPDIGKKRVAETALKTPASDKKAKIATPSGQKTGDKKGAHVATPPHPAKQASKTPANSKSKEKSPKSASGSHACKSCTKTFGSVAALQSHQKAKHDAAK